MADIYAAAQSKGKRLSNEYNKISKDMAGKKRKRHALRRTSSSPVRAGGSVWAVIIW
jgi:hypothetical protein